jgi:hypothetical protein
MKSSHIGWLLLANSIFLYGQLLPSEAAAIETAWASGQRLLNTTIPVRRGFNANAPFENLSTGPTGIARMSTQRWERIEIHLPRTVATDHLGCLMINSKCTSLPVGTSLDKKNSILYWHVPNAYKGDFDLVFFQPGSHVSVVRVTAGADAP